MALDVTCGAIFGERVRELDAEHIRVTESVYPAGDTVPEHDHLLPSLCVVLDGEYEERYRATRLACGPGTAVFHGPGDPHSNRFGVGGSRCIDITVSPLLLAGDPAAREALNARSSSRVVLPRSTAYRIWRELRNEDDLRPRVLEEHAVGLLSDLLRLPGLRLGGEPPPWLLRVRERLHEEFVSPPSLAELAEDAGVHRVYLARAFRSHYGCTVGEYVRLRRVSTAAAALRSASSSLSRIAYAAGFADQSHFTRTFRDLVGLTPGEFRRRYGGDA